jgi:predicted unusual protein kinase regulating ubiquinone biosynthesis (AarF/ABC1/UbiB family)
MSTKKQGSIPTSKIKRAAKIAGTSAKVGGNYVKYYSKKILNRNLTKDELHNDNASDIYNTLSELKGSALKVAQMMSMDEQVLPTAYQERFSMSQYSAPALSYPLISKTFREYLGKKPEEVFDTFEKEAINAASIGQVHKASKDGKQLAVKIQYPGVADSISSDLKLIKPLAGRLFNMKTTDLNMYLEEVESKLIEETDYLKELKNGVEIGQLSAQFDNLVFPKYYKELSSDRILTMDWIEGQMFSDFVKTCKDQEVKNNIGQTLWDFTLYQMRELQMVHADPHPGNFIISPKNELCVIDFGCVKIIPDDFARYYYQLLRPDILDHPKELNDIYEKMGFFRIEDKPEDKKKLRGMYETMISLLGKPFHRETFDFGDHTFFQQIFAMGESISKDKSIRKMNNARGSRDAIYVMRTFFGLYNLLHQLEANVKLNYPIYRPKNSNVA